jgi:hypothetical protein
VRQHILEIDGNLDAMVAVEADEWNFYTHVAPGTDPIDKPTSLVGQLLWLREAVSTCIG